MRICKNYKTFYQTRNDVLVREECHKKEQNLYTCTVCKYETNRTYNMNRHKQRIHLKQKLHLCCGKTFFTKGDYYVHCEQSHPETRSYAITSKTKYKIINDLLSTDHGNNSLSRNNEQNGNSWDIQTRSTGRIRVEDRTEQVKTKVSLEYSVSCREFDIENIPLISFLTDHRLKSFLKRFSSAKLVNKTNDESRKEETNQTVKIAISSEQNIEKTTSTNGVKNVRTKVSGSSVSSFSLELPTKKLILHRFRSSVHEYETCFQEKSNNNCSRTNFLEGQIKTVIPNVCQPRTKISQRIKNRKNKENVSNIAFSLEQRLNVKINRGINVPMVTQQHRDFLKPIDFEKYKIF